MGRISRHADQIKYRRNRSVAKQPNDSVSRLVARLPLARKRQILLTDEKASDLRHERLTGFYIRGLRPLLNFNFGSTINDPGNRPLSSSGRHGHTTFRRWTERNLGIYLPHDMNNNRICQTDIRHKLTGVSDVNTASIIRAQYAHLKRREKKFGAVRTSNLTKKTGRPVGPFSDAVSSLARPQGPRS